MASSTPTMRPLKTLLRNPLFSKPMICTRHLSTRPSPPPLSLSPISPRQKATPRRKIITYPPPPSTRRAHPHAVSSAISSHIAELDPKNIRSRLIARNNPEAPHPGDVLLVVFRTGEPFAGTCLSVRHRGTDTALLLRNTILTTGVEVWVKIYSPAVRSVEVVKRTEKRARRARLYYMRKPEHDPGSVDKLVAPYLASRQAVSQNTLRNRGPPGKK